MLSEVLAGILVTLLGVGGIALAFIGALGSAMGPTNEASPWWWAPAIAGAALLVWYYGFYLPG